MNDDWGCVSPDKLFSVPAKTIPLSILIENLTGTLDQRERFPEAKEEKVIEIVPASEHKNRASNSSEMSKAAPKILKKRGGLTERTLSLKRVSFEIEKLAAHETFDPIERENTETHMALRLGAKPEKKRAINYKVLKEEKRQKSSITDNKVRNLEILSSKSKMIKKKRKSNKS